MIDFAVPEFGAKTLPGKISHAIFFLIGYYKPMIWTAAFRKFRQILIAERFDLVIVHDLMLLPLALSVSKKARILFDAREYYPSQAEDQVKWRVFFRNFNKHLCEKYLNRCDKIITVSEGIAREYKTQHAITSEVLVSLPYYCDVQPASVKPDKIMMMHHGSAGSSRKIELMIEMMDYTDKRFELDLMLVPDNESYFNKLSNMVKGRENVRIIPPVRYEEIIPFINRYDIGLFLVPHSTLNLRYVLPNKLFEFIQARLAVAIGPSIEMKKIVEKYDCGIVAKDFNPKSLAEKLNSLNAEEIMRFKKQSGLAARELNAEANCERLKCIVHDLIGE